MRPQVVSVTGVGSSDPIMVDRFQNPTSIGLAVSFVGTVALALVEYTFDDINDLSVTPIYYPHPTLDTLADTDPLSDLNGNLAFPPRFVRITITTGAGTAILTYIQSGYGSG